MIYPLLAGLLFPAPAHEAIVPAVEVDPLDAARDWNHRHAAEILAEFQELLRLPCVAGDEEGIARNGEWIRAAFAKRGVTLESLELPGASPLIVGRREAKGGSETTLGVYVHYDGQPVDPTRWTFDPWTPTLCTAALEEGGRPRAFPAKGEGVDPEWRLYGRASGDDKAPLIGWLAALDALAAAELEPTVNLLFLFDGEEEAGSPHLDEYLERHGERLAEVDAWLFCDGPVHQSRKPALYFGVRGVTGMEVTVYGANRPLHSGHYGNFVPNAGERLSALLSSMKDSSGRVLVEGYNDTNAPVTEADRAALAALPDFDSELRRDLALPERGSGESYFESLLRPSLNIRGLGSGNVGEAARNVVPSRAVASLDLRLARGNDPEDMVDKVERHIEAEGYTIVREEPGDEVLRGHERVARVVRQGGYPAVRTSMDVPIVRGVVERARHATGGEILLIPTVGGSLPLYLFDRGDTPILIVPIANHDNNQHAPDENLRLANLWYGVELYASLATPGLAGDRRVQIANAFSAAKKAGKTDLAASYLGEDPRVWYDRREGEGTPMTLGGGRWKEWDEHFRGRAWPGPWRVEGDTIWRIVEERNDYFRLIERQDTPRYRRTYWFEGDAIVGTMISAADPDTPGAPSISRFEEVEAWAKKHHPKEWEYLRPGNRLDPTGDRALRTRTLVNEWRASVGLSPIH